MDKIIARFHTYNSRLLFKEYWSECPGKIIKSENEPFILEDGWYDNIYLDKEISKKELDDAMRTVLTYMKQTKTADIIIDLGVYSEGLKHENQSRV